MKPIKIVQIGVGHDHAKPNFEAVASLNELFDLVGFVRVSGEEDIKPTFNSEFPHIPAISLEEALQIPDLEAAIIETTDLELVHYAKMAADKGLHVFMDKAGSQSAKEFEAMLSSIYANKKVFGIGYVLRFNPFINKTLELVKQGKLGKIYSFEGHMSRDDKDEKRRWLEQFQGGMTYFLGCHLIDQLYSFLGVPQEIIPLNATVTPHKNSAEDLGFTVFRYSDGVSFIKVCGAEPGGFARRQLVICGTQGTVEFRPLEIACNEKRICATRSWYRNDADTPLSWGDEGVFEQAEPYDRYAPIFEDFANRIRDNKPSSKQELIREARVHRIILAACGIDCDYKGDISI